MITHYPAKQLEEMNYHVTRLNRLGFACALSSHLKPGEFSIVHSGDGYDLNTCGDFSAVKQSQLPLTETSVSA